MAIIRHSLLLLVSLCGALSLLNIFYQYVAEKEVAGPTNAEILSKFVTTRNGSLSPNVPSGAESGGDDRPGICDGGVDGYPGHRIAGLSCERCGGPSADASSEMVYWSDIPSDSRYRSPFQRREAGNGTKYLTFEPDRGGWNNIRMAMETVLVLAHATGRTLVLPPEKKMYLLDKGRTEQKTSFGFNDFFYLDSIAIEHDGLEVISMETFLLREKGRLAHRGTGEVLAAPSGRTKWDGQSNLDQLWQYLRIVGRVPNWNPRFCVLGIPAVGGPDGEKELRVAYIDAVTDGKPDPFKEYTGNPTSVDAPVAERMREMIGGRDALCVYDTRAQGEPLIHLKVKKSDKSRFLTHFYAFLFFQDWRQDLYYKRFVRDHVRYIDEIVCAAARIVRDVRDRAREHGRGENLDGVYDSMHVRRGDFQYKETRIPAEDLYERSKGELEEGGTLYIATDEKDKAFFQPIKDHYNVLFLDDFLDEVKGINTNYYGMLDQLVASKGRVFYGTWQSTLSGYINRMRGYHTVKHKLEGYQDGTVQSYYFIPNDRKMEMRQYMSVRKPIWSREFPTSWRNIDQGIEEIHQDADGAVRSGQEGT